MPRYRSTLEVDFNVLTDARWEIVNVLPDVSQLSPADLLNRDGWYLMVRANGVLTPYYFDATTSQFLPFAGNIVLPPKPYIGKIGNGQDKEIIVTHNLNSWTVSGSVWELGAGDRYYQVICDVFKLKSSPNQMGFGFSITPGVEQFEVVIQ